MPEKSKSISLTHPRLVAVWPGMGNVAVTAGYYLMAKLEMHQLAEFSPRELFDLDHIEVKGGLISAGRQPRSRLFVWTDPRQNNDLVVFIGEAQPPAGKYAFCHKLIDFALELGVEKVFSFAAMATEMHPVHEARVFGAATDRETLEELRRLELDILEDGSISGLNGVLLGVAAEKELPGACLLGEMPHIFSQFPFPKASLAVLRAFTAMTRIDLDLAELADQSDQVEEQLGGFLARIEHTIKERHEAVGSIFPGAEEAEMAEALQETEMAPTDRQRIEELFQQAGQDRSKAYELKAELDRLKVFEEFEDRFLDLFGNSG